MKTLRKLVRWLRDHQDPHYRNAPLVLPNAWHGHGNLSDEEITQLNLNVRDMGLDRETVSRQPHNRMLRAMNTQFRKSE